MWLLLLCIAMCIALFNFDSQQVEAATTHYVNAKGDIFLRDAANSKAKKIATIKNHSAISVISSSDGWSYVQFGKLKGYVYTSALSKKHPKENQVISGSMSPKAGLTLTYSPNFNSSESATYKIKYGKMKTRLKG